MEDGGWKIESCTSSPSSILHPLSSILYVRKPPHARGPGRRGAAGDDPPAGTGALPDGPVGRDDVHRLGGAALARRGEAAGVGLAGGADGGGGIAGGGGGAAGGGDDRDGPHCCARRGGGGRGG